MNSLERARRRIADTISESTVPEDPEHSRNTLKWLLEFDPGADTALRFAALGHDIDRAVEARKVQRADFADYDDFKAAHARNSAAILLDILADSGVEDAALIGEIERLVCVHEVGGDPRSDLLKDADRRLAEKEAEKRDLQKQIAKVSLTAPSEGARLLVDSDEELRISSDKPPKHVRIEVQKMVVHGGKNLESADPGAVSGANDPVHRSWETIYDRTFEWKSLGSAGPGAVSLAFKTGVKPERRSIPIVGFEAFWLDRGEYRARVQRLAESEDNKGGEGAAAGGHNDWRSFSVVGKLDSEVFGKRAPVQTGGPKIKYGQKQIKPGAVLRPTGAKDEDEEDDSE